MYGTDESKYKNKEDLNIYYDNFIKKPTQLLSVFHLKRSNLNPKIENPGF